MCVSAKFGSCLKEVNPLVMCDLEQGIVLEPMQGNWAQSRVDLGYAEYFAFLRCISVHLVLGQCSWGLSGVPSKKSRLLTCLIGSTGLRCMQCRGIEPHFPARGMSHTISRFAAGTWGIFASYSGDGHSKLHFVQRSQDSCVVMRDTSGIKTRLGRIKQTLLEVRWETKYPFLVSTEILGFLSIFKKSQASSAFEALNSTSLSSCQGM